MLVFAFAFWKGGRTERTISLAMIVAYLASGVVTKPEDLGPSVGLMVVDVTLFVIMAGVSLGSRRMWTAAAAGFQLVNVLLHFAILIDLRISEYTYKLGLAIWSFLAIGALLTGTLEVARYDRRKAALG